MFINVYDSQKIKNLKILRMAQTSFNIKDYSMAKMVFQW